LEHHGTMPVSYFYRKADKISDGNAELEKFSPELAARPRIVAANKADLLVNAEDEFGMIPELSDECAELEKRCAECGYEVVYISASAKMGLKPLTDKIAEMLRELPPITVYESEITPEDEDEFEGKDADSVTVWRADDASFHLEGAWIDALMGRVNFGDRESMMYFERSLTKFGIIQKLRDAGCEEGDIVHINDFEFEFVD